MAKRLTWRNQPDERGLARVGQRPRGRIGKANGEDVLRVYPLGGGWRGGVTGWYWAGYGQNTCGDPLPTKEAAQAEANSWWWENIGSKK